MDVMQSSGAFVVRAVNALGVTVMEIVSVKQSATVKSQTGKFATALKREKIAVVHQTFANVVQNKGIFSFCGR